MATNQASPIDYINSLKQNPEFMAEPPEVRRGVIDSVYGDEFMAEPIEVKNGVYSQLGFDDLLGGQPEETTLYGQISNTVQGVPFVGEALANDINAYDDNVYDMQNGDIAAKMAALGNIGFGPALNMGLGALESVRNLGQGALNYGVEQGLGVAGNIGNLIGGPIDGVIDSTNQAIRDKYYNNFQLPHAPDLSALTGGVGQDLKSSRFAGEMIPYVLASIPTAGEGLLASAGIAALENALGGFIEDSSKARGISAQQASQLDQRSLNALEQAALGAVMGGGMNLGVKALSKLGSIVNPPQRYVNLNGADVKAPKFKNYKKTVPKTKLPANYGFNEDLGFATKADMRRNAREVALTAKIETASQKTYLDKLRQLQARKAQLLDAQRQGFYVVPQGRKGYGLPLDVPKATVEKQLKSVDSAIERLNKRNNVDNRSLVEKGMAAKSKGATEYRKFVGNVNKAYSPSKASLIKDEVELGFSRKKEQAARFREEVKAAKTEERKALIAAEKARRLGEKEKAVKFREEVKAKAKADAAIKARVSAPKPLVGDSANKVLRELNSLYGQPNKMQSYRNLKNSISNKSRYNNAALTDGENALIRSSHEKVLDKHLADIESVKRQERSKRLERVKQGTKKEKRRAIVDTLQDIKASKQDSAMTGSEMFQSMGVKVQRDLNPTYSNVNLPFVGKFRFRSDASASGVLNEILSSPGSASVKGKPRNPLTELTGLFDKHPDVLAAVAKDIENTSDIRLGQTSVQRFEERAALAAYESKAADYDSFLDSVNTELEAGITKLNQAESLDDAIKAVSDIENIDGLTHMPESVIKDAAQIITDKLNQFEGVDNGLRRSAGQEAVEGGARSVPADKSTGGAPKGKTETAALIENNKDLKGKEVQFGVVKKAMETGKPYTGLANSEIAGSRADSSVKQVNDLPIKFGSRVNVDVKKMGDGSYDVYVGPSQDKLGYILSRESAAADSYSIKDSNGQLLDEGLTLAEAKAQARSNAQVDYSGEASSYATVVNENGQVTMRYLNNKGSELLDVKVSDIEHPYRFTENNDGSVTVFDKNGNIVEQRNSGESLKTSEAEMMASTAGLDVSTNKMTSAQVRAHFNEFVERYESGNAKIEELSSMKGLKESDFEGLSHETMDKLAKDFEGMDCR